ncbi:MAG: RnfABCDGE type electron transport complex subunit B [Bacillota bacterium]
MNSLADKIDALLPQTQCTRCGYLDCRAYAEALACHETSLNRCPPGGDETIAALATVLNVPAKPMDPAVGMFALGTVAFIEEPLCIGCTKCIAACPVDAITGAQKQIHTVIEALCTGCGLCLPPCPVDCIRLTPVQGMTEGLEGWQFPMAGPERGEALKKRFSVYRRRQKDKAGRQVHKPDAATSLKAHHQAEIAAAVARVKARRAEQGKKPR